MKTDVLYTAEFYLSVSARIACLSTTRLHVQCIKKKKNAKVVVVMFGRLSIGYFDN